MFSIKQVVLWQKLHIKMAENIYYYNKKYIAKFKLGGIGASLGADRPRTARGRYTRVSVNS